VKNKSREGSEREDVGAYAEARVRVRASGMADTVVLALLFFSRR
jgi:hypothetical protein